MIPVFIAAAEPHRIFIQNTMFAAHALKASADGVGYYGEIPASEFITATALMEALNYTDGQAVNPDTNWLAFTIDGKKICFPKKVLRINFGHASLLNRNLVYGNRTVEIKGRLYKVRLMRGATSPHGTAVLYDNAVCYGSEWNRMMYRLIDTPTGVSAEGIVMGQFEKFTPTDLGVAIGHNNNYTICQDQYEPGGPVERGLFSVMHSYRHGSPLPAGSTAERGWRPVLEQV